MRKRAAFAAAFLFLTAAASSASAQLTVTPITWDVVGLDSNRPLTSGPELFPSGARVCSAVATTNVEVDFVWTDGNGSGWDFGPGDPYINLRPGSLTSLSFAAIGAGECVDAYFEVRVTRSAAAFGQSREYTIVATDGSGSASSPEPRQILVESLVSQNRNTTTQIRYGEQEDQSDWVALAYGGSINLAIGNTYFLELTTETSTAYEELQSFLTLSNTIFQVLSASTTYATLTAPPSRVPVPNPGLWADGCEWDSNPDSPNYSSCLSTGKAGGQVVTTYEILIISGGGDSVSLNAMIYDRSGGSFHYNADFSTPQGDLVTYDPAGSLLAKRFVPDTIGLGGTSRLRFTITNPNPVAISGYNFLDVLPAGVLVESPSNASTTCGGTVTAVPGTDEIALANGFVGANGSCTVLVDVTAAAAGTYNNVSQNLFIGEVDTGNNATATLTVSATDPPVLVCDENATLAQWRFPIGASATAPAPTSNLVTVSASAGSGLTPVINGTQTSDVGTGSWASDNIATGALNTANQEYFQFTIDTTGQDSITLDFASRRTSQGPISVQLYYGATGTETASSVYSLPAQNTWYTQGPTVLSTGLNSSGNTVFRLYVYSSSNNNSGHSIFIDDVRFRGLYCSEVPPPPPTGANPPRVSKNFSPTPIGVGHASTLTFTITNPNLATALSGIAFSDELPFGMSVVPATFGGTCTGFWGTDPGDSGVLLHSGGSLPGNGSCTLTVNVTSSTVGTALNISDPIYSTQSGYNTNLTPGQGIAQASLVVLDSPGIAKEFVPNLLLLGVTPNDASTLTFTVTNPNPSNAIAGVSFTDSLPAGLSVASPPNATTSGCGAPTWAPMATNTSLSFSGGSIAAGGACTVSVDVTGPIGLYDNVSSAATHIVSGVSATNGEVAEASLQIDEPIPGIAIQKEVGPGNDPDLDPWSDYLAVPEGDPVYYKIVVENTGEVPLTGLVVSDPNVSTAGCSWPNPLPVADVFNSHIATCIVGPVPAAEGTNDNTATAQANSSAGPVDDSDTATYATVELSFSKVADPLTYATAGDTIDYTFTLTNNGAAILAGPVTLTDPLVPGATCASLATVGNADAFLDPGESVVCTGSYTIVASDVTNGSVTNTAYASIGGFDSPDDTATVTSTCAPGPCCVAGSLLPAGTTCRSAAGVCDTAETCTGSSSACPADGFVAAATQCRASGGVCDVAEVCTGSSATCPTDTFASAATTCRGSAGVCDVAETCTGSAATCPADTLATAGTTCRASAGVCDVVETCTGSAATCPADTLATAGTTCRASAGVCDVAETCTGSAATCPADVLATAGTTCRASAGVCDVAETCTGSAATCPADTLATAGTTCRASAGVCDVAETCTGSAATCPADTLATAGTTCRAAAGVCDVAETCTGSAATCPADTLATAGTTCRASAGVCDVAETCTGSAATCPADTLATAGTTCRAAAGVCDVVETCTGSAATCPADVLATAGTTCRASAGVCDVAETCTGSAATCPADTLATAGTTCRAAAGVCDVAETCTGAATSCPTDAFAPASTPCGSASDSACDNPDSCNGSGTCLANNEPGTTSCRPIASACDIEEFCDGAGVCPADGINPSCGADLAIVKSDSGASVNRGDEVTYTILVSNNGPGSATAVTVVDTLDSATSYVSDTGGCIQAPLGTLTCPIGPLLAGGSAAFTVTVRVGAFAPFAGSLENGPCNGTEDLCNQVSVAAAEGDPNPSDNVDTEPTDVTTVDLSMIKSDAGTGVRRLEDMTYTIVVSNDGPATATNVTIFDTLDTNTTYVTDSVGCTQAPQGFLSCPVGTIAPGASTTVYITVQANADAPNTGGRETGDCTAGVDLCNRATVQATQADSDPTNNSDDEPTNVIANNQTADLAITKVDLTGQVQAGGFATYEVSVRNLGTGEARDAVVVDTLDPDMTFLSSTLACTAGAGGTVTCPLGDLSSGATVTFQMTVHVDPSAPTAGTFFGAGCPGGQDLCNRANVSSTSIDPVPGNNVAQVSTDVVAATVVSELSITKNDITPEPVLPGSDVTYEIVVTNSGPDAADAVVAHEVLDPYMTWISDTAGCTVNTYTTGTELECPLGTIASGSSSTFQVVVNIAMGSPVNSTRQDGDCNDAEDVCNTAAVSSSSAQSSIASSIDSEPTDVSASPTCNNGVVDGAETCDPVSGEICNNGVDDDGDGQVDCSDANCQAPGFQSCDGNCQLTPQCLPILDDPASIKWNSLNMHGRFIPQTPADPFTDGFRFVLSNEFGEIYTGTLLPGDMRVRTNSTGLSRWVWKDPAAKAGAGLRDGIFRLGIHQRLDKATGEISYVTTIRAYGDMSLATVPTMTSHLYIGDDVAYLTVDWNGQPGGWNLSLKDAIAASGR